MPKVRLRESLISYRNRLIIIGVGLAIGCFSLFFTANIAQRMREKEKSDMAVWSYAMGRIGETNSNDPLVLYIIDSQRIPFVMTDDMGRVEVSNMIPDKVLDHPDLRNKLLIKMSSINQPLEINAWNGQRYMLFYGNSKLLNTLIYFPYVQIIVIAMFVTFGFITFHSSKQDEQNRVWIGLAKETAHQLGTPISSLLGWLEYLKTQNIETYVTDEMNKDLTRLVKVADRFSKIGSATSLEPANINEVVGNSIMYFRTRVPKNVSLSYNGLAIAPMKAMVNAALFEWVVENLLKNALDAIQGQGSIDVTLSEDNDWVYVDVKDTGKGIAKANVARIFEPGFTTKTRGWGLGLSLSRRIIEEYHKGKIGVLESEIGKGSIIRIAVKRSLA